MGKELIPSGSIEPVNLREALEERYLAYALSTITQRALPDVRDGLKPVHRRLLFAMRQLRLEPGAAFKKSARVVGDVIGKFHPHGDQSVYDALVRLAQEFAARYPLVEGQGNFGNVDGDNPAAMRYTEARLTEVARLLLDGIDENAVDFRPTYDGTEEEPIVLPGAFPNLLANGSSGIAVGMATSIPPHNAAELCDAALHLIKNPKARIETLVGLVPGPDFPTGGIIVEERASILEAYRTGRGSFRVRARWQVEEQGRGTYVVVVTEIPYQIQKARLIEKIAELLEARRLPLVASVRDELAEDIRVVIEPKSRTVDAALMMESLFRLTDFEARIPLNMNVLSRGLVPRVMGLGEVINEWLAHRREVLVRRSEHRLAAIRHRLEVLDGYLIVYLNIDEVIAIIRAEDEPKPVLMKRFKLSDVQAEAILNMRLRSLRRLEEFEIRAEHDKLTKEQNALQALVKSEDKQWEKIAAEIREVRKTFGPDTPLGRRRTTFAEAPEHDVEDIQTAMVEREPITVVVSEKGWIRALKGHVTDLSSAPVQDRRRAQVRLSRRDHRQGHGRLDRRPLLHASGRQAARRARPWRADQGDGRHGRRRGRRRRLRPQSRAEAARGLDRRPRLRRAGSRDARQYAEGQAGDGRRCARGDAPLRHRLGRPCRHPRREPKTPHLPAQPGARDDARQGRAVCSATRTAASPTRASSPRPTASPGSTRPAAPSPARSPRSKTGSANAPKPAACRHKASRAATGSARRAIG